MIAESTRIPLTFKCPGSYMAATKNTCKSGEIEWNHTNCQKKVYLDVNGDIYCDGNCQIDKEKRFIQGWKFNCGAHHNGEFYAYSNLSDLLAEIANASHAVIHYYKNDRNSIQAFLLELTDNVMERWQNQE